MPVQSIQAVAQDIVLQAARAAAAAAIGAPKLTGDRTGVKTVIVYGEDLQAFVDYLLPLCGPDGRLNTYMFGDYLCVKDALEKGDPMAVVLVGGNTLRSELGWDCGACGFSSCAEFNKYAKDHIAPGGVGIGPGCNWKAFDIGMAQGFAVAAAYQMGVTGRLHYSYGAAGMRAGFIEDVSICAGVTIGPVRRALWDEWYNRPVLAHTFNYDELLKSARQVFPHHFAGFCGRGDPPLRYSPEWQAKPMYVRYLEDPEYEEKRRKAVTDALAAMAKYKEKMKK